MTIDDCRKDIIRAVTASFGEKNEEPLNLLVKELWEARVAKKTLKKICNVDVSSNMNLLELLKRL